jgi:hypothetical protein
MKGVVFLGDRRLELREFPDPTPGARDVILEIKASGMCGSDLHNYRALRMGRRPRSVFSNETADSIQDDAFRNNVWASMSRAGYAGVRPEGGGGVTLRGRPGARGHTSPIPRRAETACGRYSHGSTARDWRGSTGRRG